ncbi:MAG: hypothetical protein WA001_01880 [Patescibacteria group bacterium]
MAENEEGRFTSGELEFASWWVRNGPLARRVGHGVLIFLSVIFWGYAIWGLLDAYAISYPRESRIDYEIATNEQLLTALATDVPQNVSLSDVSVFQTTDSRYDMSVTLTNPNAQWWADFNYHFNLSGESTPEQSGYVLPSSQQILTQLGYSPKTQGGRSASLVIDNVHWHRVDPSVVGASYKDYLGERLALSFQDITYDTNITLGTSKVGQTSFTLVNNSAYGYWKVNLIVQLYRGSTPIAINQIELDNIQPGEHRPVQMTWFDNIPSVTQTQITPQVNVLDPASFLPTQYFVPGSVQAATTTPSAPATP